MINKLPLHNIHQAKGAEFIELFDWSVPGDFGDTEREYQAIQCDSGLLDLSNSVILELQGDDRTRFLHGMVTNDVKGLLPGQGCHAAFLSPQGKMVADLKILCFEDRFVIFGEANVRESLVRTLSKYIIGDRTRMVDRSSGVGLLSLQGPKSALVISELTGRVPTLVKAYDHMEVAIGGLAFVICQVARSSAGGFDLVVPREHLSEMWTLLLDKGRKHGLRAAGFASYNIHRIEAGIPLYGVDINDQTLPLEAGMEKDAISYTKGCYIGQESVARITYRGHVNRKLWGLRLDKGTKVSAGDKVFENEEEVGWISSVANSPALGVPIALAYLRREVLESGARLRVGLGAESINAEATPLPFVSPGKDGDLSVSHS